MRYLVIAPQLGYQLSGDIVPGGLLQFGRCVCRAMATFSQIDRLGIWCQVDPVGTDKQIEKTVYPYAHPSLLLDIRTFANSRAKMAAALAISNVRCDYDRVMYLLVNQSTLSRLPLHPAYDVWEIGEELYLRRLSAVRQESLRNADRLLSISKNTAVMAAGAIPNLPDAKVVPLCFEPPLYSVEGECETDQLKPYRVAERAKSVLIVANMHQNLLYKGHQQLISGWPQVLIKCPDAELWIVGDGDGRRSLEAIANSLAPEVRKRVFFFGRLTPEDLAQRYEACRAFAMPSTGEGFGLVFVEAARYGIPSIGGKYDSVREIVVDGETGILVEQTSNAVADACIKLLTDDILAARMGHNARQRYLQTFRFCHFRDRLAEALGFN